MDRTWTRTPPRGCVRPSLLSASDDSRKAWTSMSTWAARNVPRPVPPPRRLVKSRSGGKSNSDFRVDGASRPSRFSSEFFRHVGGP
jgi:hypothetical protein